MKVSAAIAQILKREGVEFLIGYPVNPIIEAAAEADIRTIMVRQERTGLHMADAVSRVTSGDTIGVFTMQHGPGVENAFGGVSQAYGESVPIVVLPAGYPRHLNNVPPNFSAVLNFQHITKSAEQVTLASVVPDALRRAFTQAKNGRPRPTLVEIPTDLYNEEIGDFEYTPSPRLRSAPDPQAVDAVAAALIAADRPVIYAGQGGHYAKAWSQLRQLAELLEAPVTTTINGKSTFPEDHPLALGCAGRSMPRPVWDFLNDADVIFGIGCSLTRTSFGVTLPTAGKTIIHATLDAGDINKDIPVQHALVGDAALTLDALIAAVSDRLSGKPRGRAAGIAGKIAAGSAAWHGEWMAKLTSAETPISPYRVVWDLLHTVDVKNTIITHDAGSPRDQIVPFWKSTEPLSYIGWGKTTQLGYGLGLAMGAKLAHPDKLCVNFWGDAAIGFTGMDFETAVRERIPILSILSNNFSMAIELPIMRTATAKYRSTDISGDYAAMARAFGGYGERVTDPNEVVAAIKRGIAKTREGVPALLEFITEKEISFSTFR